MNIGKLAASTVFGTLLGLVLALSPVGASAATTPQDQIGSFQLQQELGNLRSFVRAHNAVLSQLSVKESAPDELHTLASSCTVSAEVSIPGGTGVTITATAPTCAEAVAMVMQGIKAVLAAAHINP